MALNLTKDFVFYTIQGEGEFTGYPSIFIRLSGCNLRCEWARADDPSKTNLCDTPYSSHYPEENIYEISEIIEEVKKHPAKHVVITGGEPFLQKELKNLVSELKNLDKFITIETNGTIYFETNADFISLSPKLASSCVDTSRHYPMHEQTRLNLDALISFIKNHKVQLKFVVNDKKDLEEIESLIQDLSSKSKIDVSPFVMLMPQGIRKKEIEEASEWVMEKAKKKGWRFSDRLHIRQWGAKRAK